MKNIYKKLFKIQQSLQVGKNRQGKNYNYRNLSDILINLKPILAELELILFFEDSVVQVGDRYYIQSKAILMDVSNDECIENTGLCREADSQAGIGIGQLTGATSSYSRKYCLAGWFLLEDEENDLDKLQETTEKAEKIEETTKKEEAEKRKFIGTEIVKNVGLNSASQVLKIITAFKAKDGKEVEGVEKLELLKGQRLNVCYGRIKKLNENGWDEILSLQTK